MSTAPPIIRVTDEYDRAHITEAIGRLNTDAKAMRRRGKVGTLSTQYEATHARINALLDEWLEVRGR